MLWTSTADDTEGLNVGTRANWIMQPLLHRITDEIQVFCGLFGRPISLFLDLKAAPEARIHLNGGWA